MAAHDVKTPQGRAPFAFKLHQFISGPGKVLATLEPEGVRHITLDAQRYAPGRQEEGTQLYPRAFLPRLWSGVPPGGRSGQSQVEYAPEKSTTSRSMTTKTPATVFCAQPSPGQTYRGSSEDLPESWLDLTKAEPKVKKHLPQICS